MRAVRGERVVSASFESLRVRARRLGWRLRRVHERGPLAARYSLAVGLEVPFRASHLDFIALLIAEAERRVSCASRN